MSWSKKYYTGLTNTQHNINDDWFKNMLRVLNESGILHVPNLNKSFNNKPKSLAENSFSFSFDSLVIVVSYNFPVKNLNYFVINYF